jgi:hypothetical protein
VVGGGDDVAALLAGNRISFGVAFLTSYREESDAFHSCRTISHAYITAIILYVRYFLLGLHIYPTDE